MTEPIPITAGELAWVARVAAERDAARGYNRSADHWKRGLLWLGGNPTTIGLIGELAVCDYLNRKARCNLSLDTELRARGDGDVDLRVEGLRVQVKTKVGGTRNLVRCFDPRRGELPLESDVYVFVRWCERRELAWINGCIGRKRMLEVGRRARARQAEHWNIEISPDALAPIGALCDVIVRRRKGAA